MTVLTLALLLQASPPEQDVVHLKDGTRRFGRIIQETPENVVVETLIKGAKGQVVGSAKVSVPRSSIDRIERASAEALRKAEERSQAFAERGLRRAETLARLKPAPTVVDGARALRVEGTHFVLEGTSDEAFVKDVAACLEDVFAAYRKYFAVRRNADRKVSVYVLSDREEYDRFNTKREGGAIPAPAYYDPRGNHVVAYNMVQRALEKKLRGEILAARNDLDGFRMKVSTAERRIEQIARDLRQQIQTEAAEIRRRIRADGAGRKEERLREIDRQEKAALEDLKEQKSAIFKETQEARRSALADMEKCRQAVEHNERVLAQQNQAMFETLYHEAFHAFAANYLWEGSAQKEFPRWLHEGMACYFETSVAESAGLVHGSPHPQLLALWREKSVIRATFPTEKVLRGGVESFTLRHPSEADRQTTYYAHAWALAHFLVNRVTPAQLEAYVADVLAGGDPVKAFEQRTGLTCAQVDAELKRHIDGLR